MIEELTQIPAEEYYEDLISSCRSTISEIYPQIFATTNPDGPGFYWVKERFKIPDWPTESISSFAEITLPNGDVKKSSRLFVPALLSDNPALKTKDPSYEIRLAGMKDESRRKAWLQGYWGEPIIEGVIFNEELKRAREEGRITEVVWQPEYPVYTYWDIGRDATPILFMQLIGNRWHLIDFYEASGKGFDHYAEIIRGKPYWYGQHFGPHDLMKTDMQNETIWKLAEKYGIVFTVVPKASTQEGIEAAKAKFGRLKISSALVDYLKRISAFRRDWDDDKQVYKDQYIHDWASHAGTATFYWGLQPDPIYESKTEEFNLYTNSYT